MRLEVLVGNRRLKEQLAGTSRLPGAVLIGGPKGSGKRTLAKLLAQALVCTGRGEPPCGQCRDCKLAAEGNHPDVIPVERFLSPAQVEKDLRVDTIRALRSDAYIRPNQAARKVYLIARADTMNPSSQNALLKVLEDGPDYAAFFLLAENPMTLLQTIRSRCVEYDLSPLTREELMTELTRRFPQRGIEELTQAAEQSGGLLGPALQALEGTQGADPKTQSALDALGQALSTRSELALMEWSVQLQNEKYTRAQLEALYRALLDRSRDGLASTDGDWGRLLSRGQLAALASLAREGLAACQGNVGAAHSLGWFAASLWEVLARQ